MVGIAIVFGGVIVLGMLVALLMNALSIPERVRVPEGAVEMSASGDIRVRYFDVQDAGNNYDDLAYIVDGENVLTVIALPYDDTLAVSSVTADEVVLMHGNAQIPNSHFGDYVVARSSGILKYIAK